ncbi:hypothetical protein CLOP_g9920 [Closterium sp. NIES-67]|nr:hypothetical protein CLOP_g9920 [Closterium sp. NIES-67]
MQQQPLQATAWAPTTTAAAAAAAAGGSAVGTMFQQAEQHVPPAQPHVPRPQPHMALTLPTGAHLAAAPPLLSPTSVVTTTGVPGRVGLSMGAAYPGLMGHMAPDDKKVKRMMSNRASAKRSRKRRQERLEELEVLSASLQVDNASAQRRLHEAQDTIRRLQRCQQALQRSVAHAHAQLSAAAAAAAAASPAGAAAGAAQSEGGDGTEAGAGVQLQLQPLELLSPLHTQQEGPLLLRTPLDLAGRQQSGRGGGRGSEERSEELERGGDDSGEEEQEEEEEGGEEEGEDEEEHASGSEGEGEDELEEEGVVGGVSGWADGAMLLASGSCVLAMVLEHRRCNEDLLGAASLVFPGAMGRVG